MIGNKNLLAEMKNLKQFEILTKNIVAIQNQSLSVKEQVQIIEILANSLPEFAKNKLIKSLSKNPVLNYFRGKI